MINFKVKIPPKASNSKIENFFIKKGLKELINLREQIYSEIDNVDRKEGVLRKTMIDYFLRYRPKNRPPRSRSHTVE